MSCFVIRMGCAVLIFLGLFAADGLVENLREQNPAQLQRRLKTHLMSTEDIETLKKLLVDDFVLQPEIQKHDDLTFVLLRFQSLAGKRHLQNLPESA
ncbi:MAG: hypothetical protein ACOH5I_07835 [Oligoflexus sp.]